METNHPLILTCLCPLTGVEVGLGLGIFFFLLISAQPCGFPGQFHLHAM
jgi:hypothetical protein